MIAVLVSWKVFGGCPFTVWENRIRELERSGSAYLGSCLTHYSTKWFGLNITGILVSLLILPIIVGIL
jgi:hypothetical protein